MLKISRTDDAATSTQPTLKLEGQVRGRWVEELRRVCIEVLDSPHARLALDLADVSFIDGAGLALFEELAERKVAFTNCSMFAAEQLKGVANGRE
jgi:ABC-type transporter Mla MlaB component